MNLVHLPNGRLAIRDGDALLAVPPMHPETSRPARQRVFEYVLRRQFGLAATIADAEREAIEFRERSTAMIASLMTETPHKNRRGMGVAA